MLCREQDAAPGIDGQTPHPPGDAAGQAEFASGIQEKQNAFPHAVALAARPQANPLRNRQILAGSGATNGVFDMKGNGDSLYGLAAGRGVAGDGRDSAGKNGSGGAGERGQVDRSRRRSRPANSRRKRVIDWRLTRAANGAMLNPAW